MRNILLKRKQIVSHSPGKANCITQHCFHSRRRILTVVASSQVIDAPHTWRPRRPGWPASRTSWMVTTPLSTGLCVCREQCGKAAQKKTFHQRLNEYCGNVVNGLIQIFTSPLEASYCSQLLTSVWLSSIASNSCHTNTSILDHCSHSIDARDWLYINRLRYSHTNCRVLLNCCSEEADMKVWRERLMGGIKWGGEICVKEVRIQGGLQAWNGGVNCQEKCPNWILISLLTDITYSIKCHSIASWQMNFNSNCLLWKMKVTRHRVGVNDMKEFGLHA